MGTPSHQLKLRRAAQHLAELDALTADLRKHREYPVTESPEVLPIVLGDLLFNVRSALFRLFRGAIETDERTHDYADGEAARLLSRLQNADKHRGLVGVLTGLSQGQATIAGEELGIVPVLRDQDVLAETSSQVPVRIAGVAIIGLGAGNVVHSLDAFLEKLEAFIASEVLPRLDPFVSEERPR